MQCLARNYKYDDVFEYTSAELYFIYKKSDYIEIMKPRRCLIASPPKFILNLLKDILKQNSLRFLFKFYDLI